MSLQDDIFDIGDTLEGGPFEESWERIVDALNTYEKSHDELHRLLGSIDDLHDTVARLERLTKPQAE